MWRTVLILALVTSADPMRLGITAILVARPRPILNLLAFWLGGMAAGVVAGVTALLTLRDVLPRAIHQITATISGFTPGPVKISLGVLALLIAGRMSLRFLASRASPIPVTLPSVPSASPLATVSQAAPSNFITRLYADFLRALGSGHPSLAFVAGLGSATPPVEYLVALAAVLASGAAASAQVGAIVTFTVVVLAVVEIPLISFLAKPAKTEAVVLQLQSWLKSHRRILGALGLAAGGMSMLVSGVGSL
jgi:hypothetical protein